MMENSQALKFRSLVEAFLDFRQLLSKYSLLEEPKLSNFSSNATIPYGRPDFLILKGKFPFIIVEVLESKKVRPSLDQFNAWEGQFVTLEILGADYFILTDNNEILVHDRQTGKSSIQPFDNLFELFDELDESEIKILKSAIGDAIPDIIIENLLKLEGSTGKKNEIIRAIFGSDLVSDISYNREGRFFHFAISAENELGSVENKFFQGLLDEVDDQEVCRYTTLDTLFHMITGKSFRMGSHLAMNDRGEIDYFDKYIGTFYKPLIGLDLKEMHKINNSYISSCTEKNKEDDLTMYRLYGDDSKGVCLSFNVTNGLKYSNMLIRKISYGGSRNYHFELELLKNFISTLSARFSITFRFLYLDIWKHFFKSFDYRLENEVRLLYIKTNSSPPDSEGWVITNPDRIVSKYVLFNLNSPDFPLRLSKIILGPNLPEKQLNKKQIEVYLDEQGLTSIKVEISEIESYRKS